ncbi:MAG: sigma-70 family RNA polymerase sigma factor [Nocardioides sp.]|uniref:RNA polymerase sigma factor n=1 Tax=Nocardioides sp. TaxID=35761 RepID=UPI0039E5B4D3
MRGAIDAEQFEELYGATVRDVLAYAHRRGAASAEDLAAEVYVVAWRRRADLPAPMLRRAWLFGVARTLLKADGREQRRDRELANELAARPEPSTDPPRSDRRASVVAAAVARLPPNDREVLQLVAWEGLSPAELAVALGVRPGTARVRLHRARQTLASDPAIRALVAEPTATVTTAIG